MSVDDTCIGFDDLRHLIVDSAVVVMSLPTSACQTDELTFAICQGPAMPGGHTDVILTVTSGEADHVAAVISRDECNRLAMLFTRAVRDWPT